MEKISKSKAKKNIEKFFNEIENKSPKEIRKIKKFAMRNSIKLGGKRKTFCGKCFNAYKNPKIRIKKGIKKIVCEKCGEEGRWKVKG